MRLNKLEQDELEAGLLRWRGSGRPASVEPGPGFYHADVYRQADFQLPSKVLLVDDEREFAQTLSERLLLREIGSAVVLRRRAGACKMVAEDEPEVLVLGPEDAGHRRRSRCSRRIKRDYPKVEVIILTGHGSERDMEQCMQPGRLRLPGKAGGHRQALRDHARAAYDKVRAAGRLIWASGAKSSRPSGNRRRFRAWSCLNYRRLWRTTLFLGHSGHPGPPGVFGGHQLLPVRGAVPAAAQRDNQPRCSACLAVNKVQISNFLEERRAPLAYVNLANTFQQLSDRRHLSARCSGACA